MLIKEERIRGMAWIRLVIMIKIRKIFTIERLMLTCKNCIKIFLAYLPEKSRILDAGCGVGRDAKFFLGEGYEVVPFDGSLEMVKIASRLLEKNVLHMLFQDVNFSGEFDAIWANASLLHIPYENLRQIMIGFHKALLPSGILYASFKYGTSMRQAEDRFFFDMNEANIEPYLNVSSIFK